MKTPLRYAHAEIKIQVVVIKSVHEIISDLDIATLCFLYPGVTDHHGSGIIVENEIRFNTVLGHGVSF